MSRSKLARWPLGTIITELAVVTIRAINILTPGALGALESPNHVLQDDSFTGGQREPPVPEVGELVARLGTEEIALVAELLAAVLFLDQLIEQIVHVGRRPRQGLVHPLILIVHQVVLLGAAVRGPLCRSDVDCPRGRGQTVPSGFYVLVDFFRV